MIDDNKRAEILRLFHAEAWKVGTIAGELGLHHDVIERVLAGEGVPRMRGERLSIVDPFLPFIEATDRKSVV